MNAPALLVALTLTLMLAGVAHADSAPAADAPPDPALAVPPAVTAPPAVASPTLVTMLAEVRSLAASGARQLALQRIGVLQPAVQADPAGWMAWERERIQILESRQDWDGVVARLQALPTPLGDGFRRWARGRQAAAELARGQAPAARAVLRDLLWETVTPPAQPATTAELASWRALVIHSYLKEGRVEDARTALSRYELDFGAQDGDWRLLQARVLLQSGRPEAALRLTEGQQDAEALALYWMARLQQGSASPRDATEAMARVLARKDLDPAAQARLWAVAAGAAGLEKDLAGRIQALEHGLGLGQADDAVFPLETAALWHAYRAYGDQLGNRRQLLIGADESWYAAAIEALESRPLEARALMVVLSQVAHSEQHRRLAHEYLAELLLKLPGGSTLLRRLYLDTARFPALTDIPDVVRYRLVDHALAGGELALASRLMAGLTTAPAGTDPLEWQLRRARVLILADDPVQGVAILSGLLAQERLDAEQADRLLQVIFDLQRVEYHREAIALLMELERHALAPRQQRERLFWIADSYKALARHEQAAVYYLASATQLDPHAMDPWAQTARYYAAEALAEAGLAEDARHLYQGLLKVTQDAGRRAVLRNRIQQLALSR